MISNLGSAAGNRKTFGKNDVDRQAGVDLDVYKRQLPIEFEMADAQCEIFSQRETLPFFRQVHGCFHLHRLLIV